MRLSFGRVSQQAVIINRKSEANLKIVLVDDSQIVRERVFNLVSEVPGVEVVAEAGNSIEAIECVRKLQPDVVILDIKMPGDTGIEVLRKLKISYPSLKIIMLTNYPLPQYKAKCLEYGAEFFLNKSDEFEKITDILMNLNDGGPNEIM